MRVIKLPVLRRAETLLTKIQKNPWISLTDRVFRKTGFYNILAGMLRPDVCIIPARTVKDLPAGKNEFKAVTANMLLLPPPFLFSQTGRINEFLKMIDSISPDFVFLQEVWDKTALETIITAMPSYEAVFMNEIGCNFSGLVLLSRYPIKSASAERYSVNIKYNVSELIAAKGFITAQVDIGGRSLSLAVTHLYSALPGKNAYNIEQFSYFTDSIKKLQKPVIIGADLNIAPGVFEQLKPVWLTADRCTEKTAGYPCPSKKLDYIMAAVDETVSAAINAYRVENEVRFSDHCPLAADVSIKLKD